ncbi:MAG: hypothetical protein ACFWT2_12140 [Thermoanaerobacterium thermosaccharolyticum]|jgi:hypothetical protein
MNKVKEIGKNILFVIVVIFVFAQLFFNSLTVADSNTNERRHDLDRIIEQRSNDTYNLLNVMIVKMPNQRPLFIKIANNSDKIVKAVDLKTEMDVNKQLESEYKQLARLVSNDSDKNIQQAYNEFIESETIFRYYVNDYNKSATKYNNVLKFYSRLIPQEKLTVFYSPPYMLWVPGYPASNENVKEDLLK